MDPIKYPCRYEGGFKGMRWSNDAVLELTDEDFSVSRPKTLWVKTYRIWAKWTAVTDLTIRELTPPPAAAGEAEDDDEDPDEAEPAVRIALTTRSRGTGILVVPDTDADEIWEAFHQRSDLAERFPRPTKEDEADATPLVEDTGTDDVVGLDADEAGESSES